MLTFGQASRIPTFDASAWERVIAIWGSFFKMEAFPPTDKRSVNIALADICL